ncbi:MAG TPA: type I methionyl aminopeptidase [Clostridiales bacterium]|nr:type I methionyl aminopeptidase [Clostridiales bacterium]
MIQIKSAKEIEMMRRACAITAAARALAGKLIAPGVSTSEIDKAVHDYIVMQGAVPSFLNYNGYPKSICISINDEVIHGIPGSRVVEEGDIVSVDVGAFIGGFHGDCAATFIAGEADESVKRLVEVTRQCFFEGLRFARPGYRVSDISHAIQIYAESFGYSVVRDYVGHGVGAKLHEDPQVPNFGKPGHGPRLIPGMTLAIEPMINMGEPNIRLLSDGWTVVTADGKPSAHYENTVLITNGEPEILTVVDGKC